MEDRAENLTVEPVGAVDLESAGREKGAVPSSGRQRALVEQPALAGHPGSVALQRFAGGLVDNRSDIGRNQCRIADRQLRHRADQHRQQPIGDIGLDIEKAQRRAALSGALEGGGQDIDDNLLGQCRGIDDHRVLPTGLCDQRHDRAGTAGEFEIDQPRGFGRSGKGDAGDPGIGDQGSADRLAGPGQQMEHVARDAGLVQQPHRGGGGQGGLLGGLGDNCVAGGERGRDLAGKDRQWEIPRRDAGKDATSMER